MHASRKQGAGNALPAQLALFTMFVLFAALLSASGCAVGDRKSGTLIMTSDAFNMFNGEYEVLPAMQTHAPRSIAVLPFSGNATLWQSVPENYSPTDLARRGIYNHVASLPFSDQELRETDRLLANAHLDATAAYVLLEKDPKKLRSVLGVDAVLSGEVTAFNRVFMGVFSQVAVGCEVRLTDLDSGGVLWRAKHISREFGGGVGIDPISLALSTLASAWNIRDEQYERKTDDLFREIIQSLEQSLPENLQRRIPPTPKLDFFALVSQAHYFRAGETLRFRIVGDAGCEAYVDMPGYKTAIPLAPLPEELKYAGLAPALASLKARMQQAGTPITQEQEQALSQWLQRRTVYEGTVTVAPDDLAMNILPRGYLITPAGGITGAFADRQPLVIDAKSPLPPSGLKVTALNGGAELEWKPSPTPDVQQYDIYMSTGEEVAFTRLRSSGDISTTVASLRNFIPVRFRVVAVDAAGNESAPTRMQRVIPVPEKELADSRPAPQQLSGTITGPLRLSAMHSPYTVHDMVSIVEGGGLYIEPGVTIRFASGTGITLEGGYLRAEGESTRPIRFMPISDNAPAGSWKGIVIRGQARASLQHVYIIRATTGVDISGAAAPLQHVDIELAATAGVRIRENARVEIYCSRIVRCSGMGAIVTEGKGAIVTLRHCVLQGNTPFDIQNYSPLTQDISENYWPEAPKVLGNVVTSPQLTEVPDCR